LGVVGSWYKFAQSKISANHIASPLTHVIFRMSLKVPVPTEKFTIPTKEGHYEMVTYLYKPSTVTHKDAIIIIGPDAFGVERMDTHMFAEKLATKMECNVAVPDTYRGKPVIGTCVAMDAKQIDMSIFGTLIGQATQDCISVAEFFHKSYTKIGFVGFCFCGGIAQKIAISDSKYDALVGAYGRIDGNECKDLKKPISFMFGEDDNHLDDVYAANLLKELRSHENLAEYEVKVYPAVGHGFIHHLTMGKAQTKQQGIALDDIHTFLKKHMKL
jgi:carboxymethylenebutenolidase